MTIADDIFKIHLPKPRQKILEEIASRWSPRYYTDVPIQEEHLEIIFEAARWTPSAHNQQPWRFFYTRKGANSYKKLFSALEEYNQSWSKTAPVLILACAIPKDNPFAFYTIRK